MTRRNGKKLIFCLWIEKRIISNFHKKKNWWEKFRLPTDPRHAPPQRICQCFMFFLACFRKMIEMLWMLSVMFFTLFLSLPLFCICRQLSLLLHLFEFIYRAGNCMKDPIVRPWKLSGLYIFFVKCVCVCICVRCCACACFQLARYLCLAISYICICRIPSIQWLKKLHEYSPFS